MKRASLAALVILAGGSLAFVRSRTESGVPVYWTQNCAYVQPDSGGSPDLTADELTPIIQQSMANWATAVGDQAYLKLIYDQPAPLEAHLDGINTIKFRTDRWCHPDDAQQNNVCYDGAAAAITTVFFVQDGGDKAGAILDADIELNSINFTFAVLPTTRQPRPNTTLADLENTLTHELGHLQGLDHTCKADAMEAPQELDQNGNPPPLCSKLSLLSPADQAVIRTATMFPTALPGETSKRMPKADDVAGIVNAYPSANDPGTCKHTNLDDFRAHGCSFLPGRQRATRSLAGIAILLAALVILVARRRRM